MPVYLVRWPTLSASLVRARNEEDLLDLLDQVADPGGCTYQVYRGPLWVDFDLPFEIRDITPEKHEATDPSDFTVDPTSRYEDEAEESLLTPSLPSCDAVMQMRHDVLRRAFPLLADYLEKLEEVSPSAGAGSEGFPEGLRSALVAELWPYVRHLQGSAALDKRDDYEATLMKQMGVTTMVPAVRTGISQTLERVVAEKAD